MSKQGPSERSVPLCDEEIIADLRMDLFAETEARLNAEREVKRLRLYVRHDDECVLATVDHDAEAACDCGLVND